MNNCVLFQVAEEDNSNKDPLGFSPKSENDIIFDAVPKMVISHFSPLQCGTNV